MRMNTQAFETGDALLNHLLDELQRQPRIAKVKLSGTDIDTVKVVREFLKEVPPCGTTRFVQYAVVWLHQRQSLDAICSEPSQDEYNTALNDLRNYREKHYQTRQSVLRCLARFGEHLIQMCIYPLMERPNPVVLSSGSSQTRSASLRPDCLRRDGHRCVVTSDFDVDEAATRWELQLQQQGEYMDDNGISLHSNPHGFRKLKVVHIIPRSLGWKIDANANADAIGPYLNVYLILDMFRPGTMAAYHGEAIDSPANAMAMTFDECDFFGHLLIFFEPVSNTPHTYIIRHVYEPIPWLQLYPKTITFRSSTTVDLPDPGLLAIHRACARIAHATGAGESAQKFFQDLEEGAVEADGSTALGHLVAHQLSFGRGIPTD